MHQRTLLTSLSLLLIAIAAAIVVSVGLPDRADYTGRVVGAIGRVAPEIDALAPPFQQLTLSGEMLSLSSLRGQSVIVNFWATWCVPCRAEMPELQSLHEERSAMIIGVNIGESRATVSKWIDELGLTFPIVLDPEGRIYSDYRIRAQPTTIVINPDGIITHIVYGSTTAAQLEAALQTH